MGRILNISVSKHFFSLNFQCIFYWDINGFLSINRFIAVSESIYLRMMISLLCIMVFSVTLQVSNGGCMDPKTPQPDECRPTDKPNERFVDPHNEFRSQVKPSAADMENVVSWTVLLKEI